MAHPDNVMPEQNTGRLSIEELREYPGFKKMENAELEQAIVFIEQMAELIILTNQ
jgi:hypothetical protein